LTLSLNIGDNHALEPAPRAPFPPRPVPPVGSNVTLARKNSMVGFRRISADNPPIPVRKDIGQPPARWWGETPSSPDIASPPTAARRQLGTLATWRLNPPCATRLLPRASTSICQRTPPAPLRRFVPPSPWRPRKSRIKRDRCAPRKGRPPGPPGPGRPNLATSALNCKQLIYTI
jgi:hypothetical protein